MLHKSLFLIFSIISKIKFPFKYSEEIRGEILFVLYKILILQNTFKDDNGTDAFITCGPKLLRLSLEALMKTESDDVRLNCIGLSISISLYLANIFLQCMIILLFPPYEVEA